MYGLMGDAWAKPRIQATAGERTIAYSSPEPLRIEATASVGDQWASKEWWRSAQSGLRIASSRAIERQWSRSASIAGSFRAVS